MHRLYPLLTSHVNISPKVIHHERDNLTEMAKLAAEIDCDFWQGLTYEVFMVCEPTRVINKTNELIAASDRAHSVR